MKHLGEFALKFLQQTRCWDLFSTSRGSFSSTLLRHDCNEKIELSSRGRVCFKIFAANVVLDLLQGVKEAFKYFASP